MISRLGQKSIRQNDRVHSKSGNLVLRMINLFVNVKREMALHAMHNIMHLDVRLRTNKIPATTDKNFENSMIRWAVVFNLKI